MRALLTALALLPLLGCTGDPDSPYPDDPPGAWYPGDFHVHATGASNDTGGDSYPEDIAAMARERGLYFVVLTDHSNATGSDTSTTEEDPALFNLGPEFPYWDKAAELSVPGELLMIDGNEISPVAEGEMPMEARGHIGCVPDDLTTFDTSGAFIDRPRGEVTGGDALAQAKDRGCYAVLNHPYSFPWISYDWTAFDYDAMEIYNGTFGVEAFDEISYVAWRCDLLAGRSVTAVGGSDNHRVFTPAPGMANHPALGYPTTAVFASDGTWPAIMDGLKAGRTIIYEGDSRLQMDTYDASYQHAAAGAVRIVRLRGALDAEPGGIGTLALTRVTACDDPRPLLDPPSATQDDLATIDVPSGDAFDHEVAIDGGPGVYAAVLRAPGIRYWAFSQALVIE